MTWTYDATDLSTDLAKVRLMIGDTDTTDQQLTDEEIQFYIDDSGTNLKSAASKACKALAAQYARQADKTVGDLSISYSQRAKSYYDLSAELTELSLKSNTITPFLRAKSKTAKDAQDDDTDRVKPLFERGDFDNPNKDIDPTNNRDWC